MKKIILFNLIILGFCHIALSQVTIDSIKYDISIRDEKPILKMQLVNNPQEFSSYDLKKSSEISSLEDQLELLRKEIERFDNCECQEKYILQSKISKLENYIKNLKENKP
ncbi:MAG: hypothetical protein N2Z72_08525 [Bacteroidales bacterium]|nr:hypothetical protein [Bacteroidales bacterium]